VVKTVMREEVTQEQLGGATVHASKSGEPGGAALEGCGAARGPLARRRAGGAAAARCDNL